MYSVTTLLIIMCNSVVCCIHVLIQCSTPLFSFGLCFGVLCFKEHIVNLTQVYNSVIQSVSSGVLLFVEF